MTSDHRTLSIDGERGQKRVKWGEKERDGGGEWGGGRVGRSWGKCE